jgi:putative ABC transport system permease protein
MKLRMRALVQDSVVLDYEDVNQNIGLRIEGLAVFVGEMALLALVLGSMGVAIAVRQHVEQRVEIFAMMKMIGARNGRLVAVFIAEVALMIAAALPVGAALGWALKMALLSIAARFFVLPAVSGGSGVLFLEAAGAAILAMIPAVAEPIWMLCRLRPAPFLRKESPRLDSPGRALVSASAALLCGALVGVGYHVLGSWNAALLFCGGLLVGVVFTFVSAKLCLRAIAAMKSPSAAMRLGLGNLTRQGNHAALLIATIATGTMMMVATLESGAVTMRAVDAKLPYDLTNGLLIAGFQANHREQILSFARSLPGVENAEMKTLVGVRFTVVEGVPVTTAGSWYVAGCSEQGLTIDRAVERRTGATKGSRVVFVMGNRRISETVAAVVDENRSYPVEISCNDFIGAHLFNQALVRVRPGKLLEVDEMIRARFPSLAVVTAQEIEEVIEDLSRDTKRLAWIVAAFWVAAGVAILITLIAASRSQRLREAGVLSALGATPRTLARIYTIEFALIGAIAGVIGSVAASGFASLLLGLIFYRWEFAFGWPVVAGAVVCSVVLTTVAGWLPTFSLIRQKPMNVLRGI